MYSEIDLVTSIYMVEQASEAQRRHILSITRPLLSNTEQDGHA
jgi:hypothetical protein